ncbi:FtsH protease activity modulator HflK [Gammaproteobacteria bacterium]|nr:FtsH protease activity modulator HflK [Gammaproteobacteria bacterium]
MLKSYQMSEKDPWDRSRHDQPPGLDEIFEKFFSTGSKNGKNGGDANKLSLMLVIIFSVLFIASGFFVIYPAEKGVVLRFGHLHRIAAPGPNWMIPLVDTKEIVDVHKISAYNYQAEMLTRDENYADVAVTVFYRVQHPEDFLFNSVDPVNGLAQATASALRQVVGSTDLEDILTTGREDARAQIQEQVQDIVNRYKIGIEVTDTKLQDARPPVAVKAAFDDVIQAREDYDRYMMQAEAYKNKIVPQAEGRKMRLLNEAEAKRDQIILDAKAQVAGFIALLKEYRKDPKILQNRLYLATMREVYTKTQKVFISSDNNMSLLPLAEVFGKRQESGGQS